MRRTHVYLDDQMWRALDARARREKTAVSELIRQAVRERYLGDLEKRRTAMRAFVGIRDAGTGRNDGRDELIALRSGSRTDALLAR